MIVSRMKVLTMMEIVARHSPHPVHMNRRTIPATPGNQELQRRENALNRGPDRCIASRAFFRGVKLP
jgi:hypothetical protein